MSLQCTISLELAARHSESFISIGRADTAIAVAFLAVSSIGALLGRGAARVQPVALQAPPVLATPSRGIVLAPIRLGFTDLAVILEKCVHRSCLQFSHVAWVISGPAISGGHGDVANRLAEFRPTRLRAVTP